ncbi:MAG: ribosome recycling factor [Dehalococcoidales bacterium]|nr:ribosome recycling factor [Dehalococcoidales bacterium]
MVTDTLRTTDEKMKNSIKVFRADLAAIRTGHASPALVEGVKVDYGGVPLPLNQLATITAPEANLILIQPWDKNSIGIIMKTIQKSELGLNPTSDGNVIRIVVPPLSEERRQELIKVVYRHAEEKRVAIRNIRHEAMNKLRALEKNKEISQDEFKRAQDQLQKLTDACIAEIDKLAKIKEQELLEV